MSRALRLALWNANGLSQHGQEVKTFLLEQEIDIMLISETHNTRRSYFKIPRYTIYDTQHPDGSAHGGTAIIIKNVIKHHEIQKYDKDYLQATSVVIEDWLGPITVSAIYCPPKHKIKNEQFEQFYKMLGHRFIAGGDYNAKHQQWGSRLATSRGRELRRTMLANNYHHISTGEPTYWPTDRRKLPDLIDFCVIKGISTNYLEAVSCLDLSSDHSPVIVTLSTQIINNQKPPTLCNRKTDWDQFRTKIVEDIDLKIPLKTEAEIDDAVEQLNVSIQKAAWASTPEIKGQRAEECPAYIKEKIKEKRKLRQEWQKYRLPEDKSKLNRATKRLNKLLHKNKNQAIQDYLAQLSPTENTDYSLWKATRKLKQPQKCNPPIRKNGGGWARNNEDKAARFAEHLEAVFQPHETEATEADENAIKEYLDVPLQMELPTKPFTIAEVSMTIQKDLNARKAPGYELISGKILKELPEEGIRMITYIANAIIRTGHFPSQWKVAQIILIPKPGKAPEEVESYRPISLLPCLSKLFEKLLLKRVKPILIEQSLIPAHQFGFRQQHSTIEQVHRIADVIRADLEEKRFCSALFLDIGQAFDRVWHVGLLHKIKRNLPADLYLLLKSYLTNRYFTVKYQDAITPIHIINAGVPQGSVLGPVLYLLYTSDIPVSNQTTMATFADDTAILASHDDPKEASKMLQNSINDVQNWMKRWRIRVNEAKSNHVTFTMRRDTCPPVQMNGQEIPQTEDVKYLGMHLDRRLTWRRHIWTKRKQLGLKYSKMYWLMSRNSSLTMENKLLLYKAILKPVWTYGIQLWGSGSNSNIEILQRFQSKILRIITGAPWYVTNEIIHRDLGVPTIREEIRRYGTKYQIRLNTHPNELANSLLTTTITSRLKRHTILNLPNRQ